jgi:hypothetical protein
MVQHKFPDAKFSKGEIKQRISVKLRRHKANNKKVCAIYYLFIAMYARIQVGLLAELKRFPTFCFFVSVSALYNTIFYPSLTSTSTLCIVAPRATPKM